jgi:MFS family permease
MRALFRPIHPVPPELRSTFFHLYMDIAWFGVLSASALSFVSVYAARQGASGFQIGLLGAGPAVVNLLFTFPAGRWLERQSMSAAVFWTAALSRIFYLPWVFLPWLLAPQGQVWTLVSLTLLLSIPGTPLAVGFNALFAEAVPKEWRGHVVALRNALLAIVYIGMSLLCGQILVRIPFPTGYQVVFALGFIGAVMSTVHLWFLVPAVQGRVRSADVRGSRSLSWPSLRWLRSRIGTLRLRSESSFLRMDVLHGPYGKFIAVLFNFYLSIYLAIPLFSLYWVNDLHLTDQTIGLGTALFYVSVLVGSTQLARLSGRLGNQRVTAIGAMFMSLYPALMALSRGVGLFLAASIMGGLGWSLVGGALVNYLLEKVPEDRRPSYLVWYNLAINAALLLGSLAGPVVAEWATVRTALAIFAGLRFVAALVILRWE